MKNDRFRRDADRLLSSLTWTQADTNRVLSKLEGEKPIMKRKISLALVVSMALILFSVVALATGLIFSPRYDAVRLANEALEEKYGVTPAMMTLFQRTAPAKDGGGNDVLTYSSMENQWAEQLGVYTVTVNGKTAQAAWSHDGEEISEGFSSPVWGKEQLQMILSDYAAACQAVYIDEMPVAMPDPAQIEANRQRRAEEAAFAKAKAKITLEQARALAVEAIAQEYALTDAQRAALTTWDDEYSVYYAVKNEQPVISLCYVLTQSKTGEFTEGDGQYWVSVQVETGVIEDVLYDSGLAGNG